MTEYEDTITALFGDAVEWDTADPTTGYITCPGVDKHTSPTRPKDTRLYLNGVPTVFCLHQKCKEEVEELTENIRGALSSAGYEMPKMSEEISQRARDKRANERTRDRYRDNRQFIYSNYQWDALTTKAGLAGSAAFHEFASLMFNPDDIIWVGDPEESGDKWADRFRTVEEWFKSKWPIHGQFICPNPLRVEAVNRSINCLADLRYFVIEADECSHSPEENKRNNAAIFRFLQETKPELKLKAVVDAGNKSLHGWYDYPGEDLYRWCVEVLPGLGADPATMRLAQPVRCPGLRRNNSKMQRLLWTSK